MTYRALTCISELQQYTSEKLCYRATS